jgi:hypothetical protein
VRFTATGLPTGLSLNPTTGEISGRPTVSGRFSNILITATNSAGKFVLGPYSIDIADFDIMGQGSWVGWVDRAGTNTGAQDVGLGGRLNLNVTRNGSVTGQLLTGTKTHAFTGLVDSSGPQLVVTATIARVPMVPLSLNVNLDPAGQTMSGTVNDGGDPANVLGWRAFWSATNAPVARQGTHHLSIVSPDVTPGSSPTLPEGDGYAVAVVSAAGVATVTGRAGDGSVLSSTAPMGSTGQVLLHQPLYSGAGSVISTFDIQADTAHSATGSGSWSKGTQAGSKLYATGWATPLTLTLDGGLYFAPEATGLPLDAAATAVGIGNLAFSLLGGGEDVSTTTGDCNVRVALPAVSTALATTPNAVTVTVNRTTGLITGSFKATMGTVVSTVPIFGVVVPDTTTPALRDGMGMGHFVLTQVGGATQRSGLLSLTKLP